MLNEVVKKGIYEFIYKIEKKYGIKRKKLLQIFEGEKVRLPKVRYDKKLLEKFCQENQVELIGEYENVIRNTKIRGKCKTIGCLEEFEKVFKQMCKTGAFCKKCSDKNALEKSIKTCLEKYGVKCSLQAEKVKEKIKKTCLEKYGIEIPTKSEEVKEKTRKTNLEKYGVKNPLQSEEIKEKSRKTMIERYGVEIPAKSEKIREKTRKTNLERYGVEIPAKSEKIRQKMKETMMERYGVENPLQSEEVKEKIRETNIERYGFSNPMYCEDIKEKVRQTNLKRRGVEYPSQCENVKDKIRKTNIERYGCPVSSQNPEVAEKNSKSCYKSKPYTFPSGKIIKIQGYEHYALDELAKTYSEEDIITGCTNVPKISYEDLEGKNHVHYPDIFIKSENRLIEVKSTWTAEKKKDCIFLKQNKAKEMGYVYEIWIYDGKGEKEVKI